jgi:hypothetical protein
MKTLKEISIDSFTEHYLICALWSSVDNQDNPMDDNFSLEDLSKEAVIKAKKDCESFQDQAASMLDSWDNEQAGHDFWLTRNGHGTGFWDRENMQFTKELTELSKKFGQCEAYIGDDKNIHFFGS